MIDLILEKKTGFESRLPFQIFDGKGNEFYSDSFTDHLSKGEPVRFNLPAGIYKYNGSFLKLDSPVDHGSVPLPPKERHIGNNPKKYKIIFGSNPNKCTIFYEPGIILFDTQYENAPLYIKYGIYFHELGHHYYRTEWKADLYASKKMLDYGFNPSQVGRVGLMTLSNNSFARKAKTVNLMSKK